MNLDPSTLIGSANLQTLRLSRGRSLPLGVGGAVLLHRAWCASHRLAYCDCCPEVRCSLPPLYGSPTRRQGLPDRFAHLIPKEPPPEQRRKRERTQQRNLFGGLVPS